MPLPTDDLFEAISDFIKGKTGPQNIGIAKLSISGDFRSEDMQPPPISETFAELAAEYTIVKKGISGCSLESCLAIFGAMMTLPEFQSNIYRLEVLVKLAFLCAKGKSRPTSAQVAAWFNQLDRGTCGRMEDPAEDVFVSNVTYEANKYRLFEGISEANAFHTQLFLTIMTDMPNTAPYRPLKTAVLNLLRLSEEVAARAGLHDYMVGSTIPASKIKKPDGAAWSKLKKLVEFSFVDLKEMNISVASLVPFTVTPDDLEQLAAFCPGHGPVDMKPVYKTQNGIIVFQPELIGTAIRYFLIENCLSSGMEENVHAALANTYAELFSNEPLLGMSAPLLKMQRYGGFYAAQVTKEIDAGRFIHLVFFVDGFEGFEEGVFLGVNQIAKITPFVERSIFEAHRSVSGEAHFREGLTVVIGGGWGRRLGLGEVENPMHWRNVMIPANDVLTLNRTPSFKTLDILKILDAKAALSAMSIDLDYLNGFLNLYGWIKENNGHIIPHEKLDDDIMDERGYGSLAIPINCNLSVRHTAYLAADVKVLLRPDGSMARLRRIHATPRYGTEELSPFYADIDALIIQTYRSVYVGKNNNFWVEAHTNPDLDSKTRFGLCDMIMHWSESVFRFLDESGRVPADLSCECRVYFSDSAMRNPDTRIPGEDEIASIVDVRTEVLDDRRITTLLVKEGFISSARRSDNFGERAIVKAIVLACLKDIWEQVESAEIDGIVTQIVRSDRARHFHAFSVPQMRDYVRDDLPQRPLVIERLDDANLRLGLGWLCRDRSEGSRISGLGDCNTYLRRLVDTLIEQYKVMLGRHNRAAIIEALLRNHEAVFKEIELWNRTFGAIAALSAEESLAIRTAIEKLASLNAASMASRIAIEAALCHSPVEGGLVPGTYEIGQLMTHGALIHHMGGYSEAMTAGIMPPEIRISPAGDVMMDHGFSHDVIRPFGELFQTRSLRNAVGKYAQHYVSDLDDADGQEKPDAPSEQELKFLEAWRDEFGFDLSDLVTIAGEFDAILKSQRKAVLSMRKSELIARLVVETKVDTVTVGSFVATFSSVPREAWNVSPNGFLSSAWFPWRFQRQLSIVSRPIIQIDATDDPVCLIAPAMIIMHIAKFVDDTRFGALEDRFFRTGGLMSKWIGSINADQGEAFNERVAAEFLAYGWEAKGNLSDGQILARRKDPAFGDVDVLAWNKAQGRVFVIECKDLSFDKTIGEIARRLEKYQGVIRPDGKRDDLRKHLDRCETIEANIQNLSKFVGFNVASVERMLVLSQATPLQFARLAEKHSVTVITFEQIADRCDERFRNVQDL